MTDVMDDLWGELPPPDPSRPPARVLQDQALILGNKTGNVLEGQIAGAAPPDNSKTAFKFQIAVPSLGNYSIDILQLSYPTIELYPVTIVDFTNSANYRGKNEDDLKAFLSRIFQSDRVRHIIASLLRNAHAAIDGKS